MSLSDGEFGGLFKALAAILERSVIPQEAQPEQGEDPQINVLVSDTAAMQQDIEDAAARCAFFEQSLTALQFESETLLTQGAASAMDSLLVLVGRIESLHRLTQDHRTLIPYLASRLEVIQARTPLVNACKSQSQLVFTLFRSLNEKAKDLTQQFTELATDLTFEICLAQERIERLRDMEQIAQTLRVGVENQRQSWNGRKVTAEAHVQQARETVRSAERKRDSRESARVVRNILTLGIGEVFDFFDINEEIEDAERTVASAGQHVRACEQSIQRAATALQRIDEEVVRLNSLGSTLHDQERTLEASVAHGQSLRTRTIDLTNTSLDVTLFVGRLAAKSETLAVHYTAREFAQGVLNFGELIVMDGRLNSLLPQLEDTNALQETLGMIARSDPVSDTTGIDRFLETARPSLVIEDLM